MSVVLKPVSEEARIAFAKDQWSFPEGVTFLNHGSFGPTPRAVRESREGWLREHAANPMDFFVRRVAGLMEEALHEVARLVKCHPENLIFVQNATSGMNIVAENTPLSSGDEVLLSDHEYGAVVRIWGQACQKVGAKTVLARLPDPLDSEDEVIEAIFAKATPRTKMLVVSHVTSATAVIMPVKRICERARELGIPVCIDGPHALAQIEIDINSIPCDFYAVSCHKWLCAPYGTGFLYVKSRHKQGLKPNLISWGKSLGGRPASWRDEFHWPGTFDPTGFLAIPVAIQWLRDYGIAEFRRYYTELTSYAKSQLLQIDGARLLTTDAVDWNGSMVTVRLPVPDTGERPSDSQPLQVWLWEKKKIEIPVVRWRDFVHTRVSSHLYNDRSQIDYLVASIREFLETETRPN
ncbi:aminotransferase class V-fold PLP-dependent enzyme [Planctomicrobium sp. SH668]|uniref:aminotransferase class V-fold PLP-dependent enzyme n=1 Tax=Planctomicrobium sp. SH668 TaxID=3448126 RepID=UPI003F5C094A